MHLMPAFFSVYFKEALPLLLTSGRLKVVALPPYSCTFLHGEACCRPCPQNPGHQMECCVHHCRNGGIFMATGKARSMQLSGRHSWAQ